MKNSATDNLYHRLFITRSGAFLASFLAICVPVTVFLIIVFGAAGYHLSQTLIGTVAERTLRIHTVSIAGQIEAYLYNCIRDLNYLRQEKVDASTLVNFLKRHANIDPGLYTEAAFITESASTSLLFVQSKGMVHQVVPEDFANVYPNPMRILAHQQRLEEGEIILSPIGSIDYPLATQGGDGNRLVIKTMRLITQYRTAKGSSGYVVLGIDVKHFRNFISRITISKDNVLDFEKGNGARFSYLFDTNGWVLFQSEDQDAVGKDLSTYLVRAGVHGTLGRPYLQQGFRPDREFATYWKVVDQIGKGENGFLRLSGEKRRQSAPAVDDYFMVFEPIRYTSKENEPPILFAGLVYIDRSKLAFASKKTFLLLFLFWTAGALSLLFLLYLFARSLVIRPLTVLQHQIEERLVHGGRTSLTLPEGCKELNLMASAASELIRSLDSCENKLTALLEGPMSESMRQPLDITTEYEAALAVNNLFPDIIGTSAGQEELKAQILKASGTSVDVFLVGETGTGKQLIAEAIHSHSGRKDGPFVAINCGALNEHLLLDALFGHVKGAHSEAKSDRKGAFAQADGGTLFLDEIQSASLNVQQALLRAIAERKIRPLGSDVETDVDFRLISATNADLTQLIKMGGFREDLYYRLHVLTIQTIPLRHHKEDIPLLAHHYLKQTQDFVEKEGLCFSRGAMQRLIAHQWPGNVRELVNCITRTVVFAEGPVIQANDLRMESPEDYLDTSKVGQVDITAERSGSARHKDELNDQPVDTTPRTTPLPPTPASHRKNEPVVLSPRQLKVLPAILEHGTITRKEYQRIVGESLPARTANHDLGDLLRKGIVERTGAGASSRYRLSPKADLQALKKMLMK